MNINATEKKGNGMQKNMHTKIIEIQKELKAPKAQYNSFGKYHYRACEDILEAAKPLCHKRGIILYITDEVVAIDGWHYVKATVTLKDVDETFETTAYAREASTRKGMDESQITGATSTYARKYALNGLFCIDDTKDADTQAPLQTYTQAPPQTQPQAPPQTQPQAPPQTYTPSQNPPSGDQQFSGSIDDENKRREIRDWIKHFSGDDLEQSKVILKQLTEFTGKRGEQKFVTHTRDLKGKWLILIHKKAKEMYDANVPPVVQVEGDIFGGE